MSLNPPFVLLWFVTLLSHRSKLGGSRFELDCVGVICLNFSGSHSNSLLNLGGKKLRVKWHILMTMNMVLQLIVSDSKCQCDVGILGMS